MLTLNDQVWIRVKAAFLRITLTKVTAAFFLFGFLHCFAQGILQSFLFTYDLQYSDFVRSIVTTAEIPIHKEFAWLTRPDDTFNLKICKDIPHKGIPFPCETVYETLKGSSQSENMPINNTRRNLIQLSARSGAMDMGDMGSRTSVSASRNESGAINGVFLARPGQDSIFLDMQCAKVLLYPYQFLTKNKREDLVLIAVQFWLFAISFIAIMYDSVPHTLAVLCTRFLATAWAAYVLWRTSDVRIRFVNLVMKPESPCHIDMFTPYFMPRLGLEIADLVLNLTALILSGGLSWKLLKMYGSQVFKRAGPPPAIIRIYRYFLAVHVSLLLSVFFLVTAMALWIDQLVNSAIAGVSEHTGIYQSLFISTTCILLPWIFMGYLAVRREQKRLMTIFLTITFIFLTCWSIMFYSLVYRWTLLDWPFLASTTGFSYLNMIASMIFGVLSRLHFGKGLSTYMNIEDDLGRIDFEHDIFPTKVADAESVKGSEKGPSQSTVSLYVPTLHSDQEKAAKNWF